MIIRKEGLNSSYMAYGPDTEELLRRLDFATNSGSLDVTGLELTHLPNLPEGLKKFIIGKQSISELPQLPDTLEVLCCREMPLTSIYSLPTCLTILIIEDTEIITLCEFPKTLKHLVISNNRYLSYLPELPPFLCSFDCSHSNIATLPQLPSSLLKLNSKLCRSSLSDLPINLANLSCSFEQLTNSVILPNNLSYLACYAASVDSDCNKLADLPSTLKTLIIYGNSSIVSLPTLPSSLEMLLINFTNIEILPKLPSLKILNCGFNQLKSLPTLPSGLIELNCCYNPIQRLPEFPNTLEKVECFKCPIMRLPAFPDTLVNLNCSNTLIKDMPLLPLNLKELKCDDTQLLELPELPDLLTSVSFGNMTQDICYNYMFDSELSYIQYISKKAEELRKLRIIARTALISGLRTKL